MAWQPICGEDELAEGKFHVRSFGKRSVGVTRWRGTLHAVLNYCPHAGAPICKGSLSGMVTSSEPGNLDYDADRTVLRCPWHHWEFDLSNGQGCCSGTGRLKTYPVKTEGGQVWVDL